MAPGSNSLKEGTTNFTAFETEEAEPASVTKADKIFN